MTNKKNILVVDDSNDNVLLLNEILKDKGYNIYSANSGERALKILDDNIPDLILLDVFMPGMDGFELCKQIKEKEKLVDIPVIFLTAATEMDETIEGFRLGAVDFITKPFYEEELLARLNTHLSLRDSNIELFKINKELKLAHEEIKVSEEKYKTLIDDVLDISSIGIFILDADFKVVWINRATEKYFGLHRDSLIGKDKRQLIQSKISSIFEDPDTFKNKVFKTYDNNTYVENFECHVLPEGNRKECYLEHWSQPIMHGLYKGGRIEQYTDITERKRADEELNKLNTELEKRVEERTAELEKSLKDVERMNELFVGREFRIKELRDEIEQHKDKR